MSKKANNEGSIKQRRDGRWEARTMVLEAGRRRRKSFYGATRDEAFRALTAALSDDHAGVPQVSGSLTVRTYLEAWLKTQAPRLRPASYRRYRNYCELHIIPAIGNTRLTRLDGPAVAAMLASCRDKGLSETTLQCIHGALHKALEDAFRQELVKRNVSELVTRPRRSTREMLTLSPAEVRQLLEAAAGDPLEAFYIVAVTSGLRLGELQALRWREVDLDRRRLRVVATFGGFERGGPYDGRPIFAEPKTSKSRRTVQLSAFVVEALRRHRAAQLERRLRSKMPWNDHDLVFTNAVGNPIDGYNLRERSFGPLLERAKLRPMRFHDLRHTATTLLMAEGVPVKVISEMLGHADISTTLRTYSHVLEPMQAAAADAMERLFSGPTKVPV